MRILQLSDTHFAKEPITNDGAVNSARSAKAVVDHICAAGFAPDICLITGDVSHDGSSQSYIELQNFLHLLPWPFFVATGNHDAPDDLKKALEGFDHPRPESAFFNYVVEDYPVRIVVLDSYQTGKVGGLLCRQRLDWLDKTLVNDTAKPTCLVLHHPPFESGNVPFDRELLKGRDELAGIVGQYKNVKRVLCGHLHRPMLTAFGGTIACSAPSTSVQVAYKTQPDASFVPTDEPPGFALHRLLPGGDMVTGFFSLP